MGVAVIHHEHGPLGLGDVDVDQVADPVRPSDPRAVIAGLAFPPPRQGGGHEDPIAHPAPHVCRVMAGRVTHGLRQWGADVSQQPAAGLVQTDQGLGWVRWAVRDIENVLYVPDEVGIGRGRNAPLLLQPRLDGVATISYETVRPTFEQTPSNRTSSSASSRCNQNKGNLDRANSQTKQNDTYFYGELFGKGERECPAASR